MGRNWSARFVMKMLPLLLNVGFFKLEKGFNIIIVMQNDKGLVSSR